MRKYSSVVILCICFVTILVIGGSHEKIDVIYKGDYQEVVDNSKPVHIDAGIHDLDGELVYSFPSEANSKVFNYTIDNDRRGV